MIKILLYCQPWWTELHLGIQLNSVTCQMNQVPFDHQSNAEKGYCWYCSYHMLYCISHVLIAKPSTTAINILLNLLEGSKGGEMTSRSTQ